MKNHRYVYDQPKDENALIQHALACLPGDEQERLLDMAECLCNRVDKFGLTSALELLYKIGRFLGKPA